MKYFLSLMILLAVLFSGCTQDDSAKEPQKTDQTPTPAVTTPSPTPTPDFSEVDFSGSWTPSGAIGADGQMLTESEFASLNADFTLELLGGGVYFVYDKDGNVMGQGEYSVSLNLLTCTAGGLETVYVIQDENTLYCTASDDSITIMSRCPDDLPEDDLVDDDTELDEEDDTEMDEEETDVPDEDTSAEE